MYKYALIIGMAALAFVLAFVWPELAAFELSTSAADSWVIRQEVR